jgi:hypothetical protein
VHTSNGFALLLAYFQPNAPSIKSGDSTKILRASGYDILSEVNIDDFDLVMGDLKTNTHKGLGRLLDQRYAHAYFENKIGCDRGMQIRSKIPLRVHAYDIFSDNEALYINLPYKLMYGPRYEFDPGKIKTELIKAQYYGFIDTGTCRRLVRYKTRMVTNNIYTTSTLLNTATGPRNFNNRFLNVSNKVISLKGLPETFMQGWFDQNKHQANKQITETKPLKLFPMVLHIPTSPAQDTAGIVYKLVAKLLNTLLIVGKIDQWKTLAGAIQKMPNKNTRIEALRKSK